MPMTDESNAAASRLRGSGLGEDFPHSLCKATAMPAKALKTLEKSPPLRLGWLVPDEALGQAVDIWNAVEREIIRPLRPWLEAGRWRSMRRR